ncbi:MAG: heparinase II/III family protein [Gemmatimonadota bacterium]
MWLPEVQVMVAREQAGSAAGFCVAAKGGHNAESHNHNDVGTFIAFVDGEPVLVDAGVETYTARTFSAERYQIWTMQSAFHNLPTPGEAMQREGEAFAAAGVEWRGDEAEARLDLDIAGAYPPEAGLASWRRTVLLRRGREVAVEDRWQLRDALPHLTCNLLTPCRAVLPAVAGDPVRLEPADLADGRRSGRGELTFESATAPVVAADEIPLEDPSLRRVWGERLTRIAFRLDRPPASGGWTLRLRRAP